MKTRVHSNQMQAATRTRRSRGAVVTLALAFALVGLTSAASAQEVLRIYGPGGPLPAMREAAQVFGQDHQVKADVTGGPTPEWIGKAKGDADIIYSGAEYMMTDFIKAMEGRIDESTVTPLYLRPSAILVRPGNLKRIRRFEDLLKPGLKILVVQGAGQTGLWEDMAGRKGNIETVQALRKNIAGYAASSAEARKTWIDRKEIDAWIIWNIWQVANPDLADLVEVNEEYRIYRDTTIALTSQGKHNETARKFVQFLQSRDGARIFTKWGWAR